MNLRSETRRLRARQLHPPQPAVPDMRTSTTPRSDGGTSRFKQHDREQSLQALMTVNLLKRLESSVAILPAHFAAAAAISISATIAKIEASAKPDGDTTFTDDIIETLENAEPEEDDLTTRRGWPGEEQIGGKVQIRLADMDLPAWEHDLKADLALIEGLIGEMEKVSPADDAKLQHLKDQILARSSAHQPR